MGYDASVYLIYGSKINREDNTRVAELLIPDLIHEYGDDVWSCLDFEPHENGYYFLNIGDDIFVACYYHEHVCARNADDCLDVTLPSSTKIEEFQLWCKNNNILLNYTKVVNL